MNELIQVSDELIFLSKEIVRIIEEEDREYEFKQNKGYVERNVSASKFKKNIVGLTVSNFEEIISNSV